MGKRRRDFKRGQWSGSGTPLWVTVYRQRIADGLEQCRNPACDQTITDANPLTLDHVVAIVNGGGLGMGNASILCRVCNQEKSDATWDLPSLAAEERAAPRKQRWAHQARVVAARRQRAEQAAEKAARLLA